MTSKYKHTHGTYKQLLENKDKILSNEIVIVDSGQPGSAVYYKTKDGEIIRLANESEIERRDNTNMKDDTLAMEIIHSKNRTIKALLITLITVIILWFATIVIFVYVPVEETTTVEQQADNGSDLSNQIVRGDYYSSSTENNAHNQETQSP